MSKNSKNIAVIGLGTFGLTIAQELTRMGNNVLGIDTDKHRVQEVCEDIQSALIADSSNIRALEECGIKDYDRVVVSIGDNTEACLLTSVNLIELGIKNIYVRAINDVQERILKAVGVKNIYLPERRFGEMIAHEIHNPNLLGYMKLGDHDFIGRLKVPEQWLDKTVSEVDFDKYELTCLAVHTQSVIYTSNFQSQVLGGEDEFIFRGSRDSFRKFADGT